VNEHQVQPVARRDRLRDPPGLEREDRARERRAEVALELRARARRQDVTEQERVAAAIARAKSARRPRSGADPLRVRGDAAPRRSRDGNTASRTRSAPRVCADSRESAPRPRRRSPTLTRRELGAHALDQAAAHHRSERASPSASASSTSCASPRAALVLAAQETQVAREPGAHDRVARFEAARPCLAQQYLVVDLGLDERPQRGRVGRLAHARGPGGAECLDARARDLDRRGLRSTRLRFREHQALRADQERPKHQEVKSGAGERATHRPL
jgi:hypothetical protein